MTEKTKKLLVWGGIIIVVLLIVLLNFRNVPDDPEPTRPTYITLPEPEILDRNDPEFVSPYDPENLQVGMIKTVWNNALTFGDITLQTNASPDIQFNNTIDVEDIVSIRLPRQSLKVDVQNAGVLIVPMQQMQDPYTTSVQQYTHGKKIPFEQQEDGTWLAEFMLGYSDDIPEQVAVLWYYQNDVEAFTVVNVTTHHKYSKFYYQWLRPEDTVYTFSVVSGQHERTFCFYANETPTLDSWVTSDMNHMQHQIIHGIFTDKDITFYSDIPISTPLTDGLIIEMQKFDVALPVNPYVFDVNNEQYMTSWIGKTTQEVESHFGKPEQTTTFSEITKMIYSQHVFYVHNQKGVTQIDIIPGANNIINGLPSAACTGEYLTKHLRTNIIAYHEYINRSDIEANYHAYALPIAVGECTVSYVWEGSMQMHPDYTEFTRIVIHSGEEYIY